MPERVGSNFRANPEATEMADGWRHVYCTDFSYVTNPTDAMRMSNQFVL